MKINMLILVVFLINNVGCVPAETANRTLDSVMFLPLHKLAFEESGTDAVARFVVVYEEGVAYIPTTIRKAQKNQTWMFINKVTTELFEAISHEDRLRTEGSNIVIYHVKLSDAGIYKFHNSKKETLCVVLEVITYENNPLTLPNYNIGFEDEHQLVVYSLWSPWSDCSVCGEVGNKRRFGICYVKNKKGYRRHTGTPTDVLEAFIDGMPCRSQYLPQELRLLPAVILGSNKIEISQCQVPCKQIIFEASLNGTVLERANNSAGIYSLKQPLPVEPPPPTREIVFAARGQGLVVKCPGSVNRNMPLRWRVGQGWLNTDSARVHMSGRDHVIIETVTNEDANLYSCWAGRQLLGSVRVEAWGGAHQWDHHCALAALIVVTTALLQAVLAMLRRIG